MFIYPSDTKFFETLKICSMSFLREAIHAEPKSTAPPSSQSAVQLGPRYQQMLDANPYRNREYNSSPWQNMLSALGFRTEADAFKENMAVQAAEYDAAIAQKAADEEYNSAAAQAERLRLAGINPDLNGGQNISAGDAAGLPQDPSTPMQTTGAEGTMKEVASGLLEAFSTAIGLVQTFQGIHASHLQNTLNTFKNEDQFQQFVRSMVPQLSPSSPESHVREDGFEETWQFRAYEAAKLFARDNLPRKFRNKFISSITQYWNSAPSKPELYQSWLEGIKNEKEYEGEFNIFYSSDRRILRSIYKHLGSAREQIEMLTLQRKGQDEATAIAEGEVREDIANNTDGKAVGEARTAEAKASKEGATADTYENEVRKILKKAVRDIVKDAEKSHSLLGDAFIGGINILDFLKGLDIL